MKNIHIPSEEIPLTLQLDVSVTKPSVLLFKGYDPAKRNTVYFRRRFGSNKKPFMKEKRFEFPLPITPKNLKVSIVDMTDPDRNNVIDVKRVKAVPLKKSNTILYPDNSMHKFVEFAKWFSKKCGYIYPKMYRSGQPENFIILYSNSILSRDTNQAIDTPARVSRVTGGIEANRAKFINYTIPMRLLILLHERMHYEKDTRSELKSDMLALDIYLRMGFPKTEAVYTLTNILKDSNFNNKRVELMMNQIYNFSN